MSSLTIQTPVTTSKSQLPIKQLAGPLPKAGPSTSQLSASVESQRKSSASLSSYSSFKSTTIAGASGPPLTPVKKKIPEGPPGGPGRKMVRLKSHQPTGSSSPTKRGSRQHVNSICSEPDVANYAAEAPKQPVLPIVVSNDQRWKFTTHPAVTVYDIKKILPFSPALAME